MELDGDAGAGKWTGYCGTAVAFVGESVINLEVVTSAAATTMR